MIFDYLTDTLSFSGLAAGSRNLALPRSRITSLIVNVRVQVQGTSSLRLSEVIRRFAIVSGADAWLECHSGAELNHFCAQRIPGSSEGQFADPVLTEGDLVDAYWIIQGPFRLQDGSAPQLFIDLENPASIDPAVTGFNAQVQVGYCLAESQRGPGFAYRRTQLQADTRQVLSNPMLTLADSICGIVTMPLNTQVVKVSMAQNVNASTAGGSYSLFCDNPFFFQAMTAAYKKTESHTPGKYVYQIRGFQNLNGPATAVLEFAEPTELVAWVEGFRV